MLPSLSMLPFPLQRFLDPITLLVCRTPQCDIQAVPSARDGDRQFVTLNPNPQAVPSARDGDRQFVTLNPNPQAVPSARDGDRQSVMHHAGRGGAPKSSLEALMEALGKDKAVQRDKSGSSPIDWLDAWGRTSLHWAVINGHSSVVSWLLSQGAQQGLRDSAGETALEMAERRARCGARERGDGERASVWANIAALLGGSGTTKNLKAKGYYDDA